MEPLQRDLIFERVSREFNINVFHRKYYCEKLSLETLKGKLLDLHPSAQILFRFDHIVVKDVSGNVIVYLFVSHKTGKCANIHKGKLLYLR